MRSMRSKKPPEKKEVSFDNIVSPKMELVIPYILIQNILTHGAGFLS